MKKTSIIRGNNIKPCPFGLPIPKACLNAGRSVERMVTIEDGKGSVGKANRLVYAYHKDCKECLFADKVIESKDAVDCDFGDTGQGQTSPSLRGSPLYPRAFGVNNGIFSLPLGYYKDDNMRNIPFGLFSLIGQEDDTVEQLIALGDFFDSIGEYNMASNIDDMLKKYNNINK